MLAAFLAAGLAVLPQQASALTPVEARLLAEVSTASCAGFLKEVSKVPHVAGSEADLRQADYIADRFREFGLDVATAEYRVLLSYADQVDVALVEPRLEPFLMEEGALLPSSGTLMAADRRPWNAYSPSAQTSAPVVYANYARPEDFAALDKLGVDVKGRLVLARYFKGYRGGKTLEAEKRGAAGLLFYSDPADDGYARGDAWPRGPWGPADHVQRGANVYDFMVPGDPLTPGWASLPGAPRIRPEESKILPRLPSAPLPYPAALKILEQLGGPVAPEGWQGALPTTYHVGPGPGAVRLTVSMRQEERLIRNVIGKLRGSREPEKLVLLSNHHDAWTTGAVDPGIGTAGMLELARVFGRLKRQGFKSRRTLVFASWDAEEYTLTGSTEWGEEHEAELRSNAVACLNVDPYRWGRKFSALAVPSLRALVRGAAQDVPGADGRPIAAGWDGKVDVMGSGSDYTVFLNHLGVPSVETTFEGPYGVYHSLYDTYDWVERFGDPGFGSTGAMTRLWGLMALRLSEAGVLPFDYAEYARDVEGYLQDAEAAGRAVSPDFSLEAARGAARRWERTAEAFNVALSTAVRDGSLDEAHTRSLNADLMDTERALTDIDGLPGRPWFKHLVYAPRPSYAAVTVPGIREAIEAGDLSRAAHEASRLKDALERAEALQKKSLALLGAQ